MKKRIIQLIGLSFVIFSLWSCTNSFQNMESAYKEGQYLNAAQYAIEGMRNPELKSQVKEFITKNGEELLKKAFFKGDRMLSSDNSERTIFYFQALTKILEEMIILDMPIKGLPDYILASQGKTERAITQFSDARYAAGQAAYSRKLYRKAADEFSLALKYSPNNKDASDYLTKSDKHAQRIVSIAPLYKPVNVFTQALGDTLANVLTGGRKNIGILKEKMVLEGIDVTDTINSKFLYSLNQRKTRFFLFSMDENRINLDNTHYYIDSIFDANDQKVNTIIKDNDGKEKLRIDYTVLISVKASIFLSKNDQEIKTINFQTDSKQSFTFDNTTEGYFPKTAIIQDAIAQAADRLAIEILEALDKDMDPYLLYAD